MAQVLNTSKHTVDKNGMEVVRVITPDVTYGVFDFENNVNIEITIEKIDYCKVYSLAPDRDDNKFPYEDVLRCAELKAVVNGKTFMIEVSPLICRDNTGKYIVSYQVEYFGENWEDLEAQIPQELIDEMEVIMYADYVVEDEHRMGLVNPIN